MCPLATVLVDRPGDQDDRLDRADDDDEQGEREGGVVQDAESSGAGCGVLGPLSREPRTLYSADNKLSTQLAS